MPLVAGLQVAATVASASEQRDSRQSLANMPTFGGTKLEVKAKGALHDVQHSTLKTDSGAIMGNVKAEYIPPFRLAGHAMEFQLQATEQSVLRPKEMKDLSGQFKLYALDRLPLTVKYLPGKKVLGCTAKLNHKIAQRSCQTEVKWNSGSRSDKQRWGLVGTECEMRIDDHNKIQVRLRARGISRASVAHVNYHCLLVPSPPTLKEWQQCRAGCQADCVALLRHRADPHTCATGDVHRHTRATNSSCACASL